MFSAFSRLCQLSRIIERHRLAIMLGKSWLVVKRVHLADAALHEQKDDSLCFGGWIADRVACDGRERVHHRCGSKCSKATRRLAKHRSTIRLKWVHGFILNPDIVSPTMQRSNG